MIKRNLSSIFIIMAMTLNILNFEFSNFDIESTKTCLFLAASALIIASIILILSKEIKHNKKLNFDK